MIKVLIVDDSNVSRAVVRKSLELAQVPIEGIFEAANGQEALELLVKQDIGLMIADIHMPKMTGMELVEAIRGRPEIADTKIVIVSSDGNLQHRERLKQLGVLGILKKPFRPEQVGSLVRAIVRNAKKEPTP